MESCKTDQGDLKLDSLWSFIGEMKDHAENALLFPRLWKVVRLWKVLTIPHSNAVEEQVFFHLKEEQNLLSAKVRSTGDTSQHRHRKTRSGV